MMKDREVEQMIEKERIRQSDHLELIASENYVSKDILMAVGSILTNKYAEGYPGKRYYGGCQFVDEIEQLAIDRAKALFKAEHANVQPHSGSQANMAVYLSVLKPGDKVLGMDLNAGGHLTHGHPLNFSGQLFQFVPYGVDRQTECLDYEKLRAIALREQPKMIVAGASAYSKIIDFAKLRSIADEVGAYLMVDMAHIAGLVAAGLHPSPVPYADFVTSTTHKTLRGPRGGLILCRQQYARAIDRTVFPGTQGGPLMHVIAGKAVCFYEAMQPSFLAYQKQVLKNMDALQTALRQAAFRLVAGGSENHVLLIDVKHSCQMTGKQAETLLDAAYLTCNKNAIPFDEEKPFQTSGIRLGTAALTTRGLREAEFEQIAAWMERLLMKKEDPKIIKQEVLALTKKFPMTF